MPSDNTSDSQSIAGFTRTSISNCVCDGIGLFIEKRKDDGTFQADPTGQIMEFKLFKANGVDL